MPTPAEVRAPGRRAGTHFDLAVQLLGCVQLLGTPRTAAFQAPLSSTVSQSLLRLTSTESVTPSNHLTLSCPSSSCPQSFPASECFPGSQFASGGQSIGASTSAPVLLRNTQGSFLLRLTGVISLLSNGLSRVFSKYHSSKASILWPSAFFMVQVSHPYMTTGKTMKWFGANGC